MSKRILAAIIAALMLCAAFTGCASQQQSTAAPAGEPEQQSSLPFAIAEGDYTIAVVSDTQFYSDDPAGFNAFMQFCEDNQETLNIEYLVHTGDIVNSPNDDAQWTVADAAFDILKTLPYGVLPGNHDTGNGEDRYEYYCKYFGEDRFQGCEWYGEGHENSRAHYDLLTMGGTDFVFVYLSDDPSACCVEFAVETFDKYSDRVGVFLTHNYLENDGKRTDMGEYFFDRIVTACPNVSMVLCGHNDATLCVTDDIEGRTVHQIMSNYQDGDIRLDGYMLFLKVSPSAGTIEAVTYSPYKDDFTGHPDPSITDEFTVAVPWSASA